MAFSIPQNVTQAVTRDMRPSTCQPASQSDPAAASDATRGGGQGEGPPFPLYGAARFTRRGRAGTGTDCQ